MRKSSDKTMRRGTAADSSSTLSSSVWALGSRRFDLSMTGSDGDGARRSARPSRRDARGRRIARQRRGPLRPGQTPRPLTSLLNARRSIRLLLSVVS